MITTQTTEDDRDPDQIDYEGYFNITEGPPVIGKSPVKTRWSKLSLFFVENSADEWEVSVRWHPRRGNTEANLSIAVPRRSGGAYVLETGFINLSRNFAYDDVKGYGANGHKLWLFAKFPHWLMSEFIEVLYERDVLDDPDAPPWMELYNVSIVPFKSDANPLDWRWTYCPATRPGMLEENIWMTVAKPLCNDSRYMPLPGLFNEFPDWTVKPGKNYANG